MKNLFLDYFYIFFNPFKIHEQYRNGLKRPLRFVEVMGISWVFKILKTFYFFIGLHFMFWVVQNHSNSTALKKISEGKASLYWILVGVIFYPVVLWLMAKFWAVLLRFFCLLYDKDDASEGTIHERVHRVCYSALSSQACQAVPVIGEVFVPICFLFFLFAGMRSGLRFTVLQALLVIVAPIFLFFLMMTLGFAYILLLLNMA